MGNAIKQTAVKNWLVFIGVAVCISLVGAGARPGVIQAATEKVKTRVEIDRGTLPADRVQTAIVKVTLDAPAPVQRARRPAAVRRRAASSVSPALRGL